MLHNSTASIISDEIVTLDATDIARILKKSITTIRSDISRRPWALPPFIRVGARALWLPCTVRDWLKQQEKPSTVASPLSPLMPRRRGRGRPPKAAQIVQSTTLEK